jgi:hypothetical protein
MQLLKKPLLIAVLATPETGTAGTLIIMDLLAIVGQLFWELKLIPKGAAHLRSHQCRRTRQRVDTDWSKGG